MLEAKSRYIDLGVLFLLTLTFPFFFYKLGQSSLVSWDEAWYADVSRNILKNGNFINLIWNGKPYYDHPPFGYWVEALSFKFFGVSEFSARLPSTLSGIFCLYTLYLLGKKLFNRWVGFFSSLALTSSPWFMYRARSGDLDILLTLLFLLTIFFALKINQSLKSLYLFSVSLSALLLTKTMVPFTIIPSLVLILWKKISLKQFGIIILTVSLTFGLWFLYLSLSSPEFLKTYTRIGFRGVTAKIDLLSNLKLLKMNLHNGLGKIFWPSALALAFSPFIFQKRFYILLTFFVFFALPFLISTSGQVWHLIPIYPILLLNFYGFSFVFFKKIFNQSYYLLFSVAVLISFYFFYQQAKHNWYEFIDISRYISDEAILSKESSSYPYKLLTDGDFDPAAIFYSGKNVRKIRRNELNTLFNQKDSFLLIINDWRIKEASISPSKYRILRKDRDKVLILH